MNNSEPTLAAQINASSLGIQKAGRQSRYIINSMDDAAERLCSQCCTEDRQDLDTILVFCELARQGVEQAEDLAEQIEKLTSRIKAEV